MPMARCTVPTLPRDACIPYFTVAFVVAASLLLALHRAGDDPSYKEQEARAAATCAAGGVLEMTRWIGRLGNNLLQLRNCLSFAVEYGCVCVLPRTRSQVAGDIIRPGSSHKFLRSWSLSLVGMRAAELLRSPGRRKNAAPPQLYRNDFFDIVVHINATISHARLSSVGGTELLYTQMREAVGLDLGRPSRCSAVVHIRSGDVFRDQRTAWERIFGVYRPRISEYVPPPLSFYVRIIEERRFEHPCIIAEDKANPVIGALQPSKPADWCPPGPPPLSPPPAPRRRPPALALHLPDAGRAAAAGQPRRRRQPDHDSARRGLRAGHLRADASLAQPKHQGVLPPELGLAGGPAAPVLDRHRAPGRHHALLADGAPVDGDAAAASAPARVATP